MKHRSLQKQIFGSIFLILLGSVLRIHWKEVWLASNDICLGCLSFTVALFGSLVCLLAEIVRMVICLAMQHTGCGP